MREQTSLAEMDAGRIWRRFMPRKAEIAGKSNDLLYSVQIFEGVLNYQSFDADAVFEKWAAVAVSDFEKIPEGMEAHTLRGGEYAVFIHTGTTEMFPQTAHYIFTEWLPASIYQLDEREHFEIMDDKYLGPANPESEEEIWIPVKKVKSEK